MGSLSGQVPVLGLRSNSGSSSPRVCYSHVATRGDVSQEGSESCRADGLGVTKPPTHRGLLPSPKHPESSQIPGPKVALHSPLAPYSLQNPHFPGWVLVWGCSGPPGAKRGGCLYLGQCLGVQVRVEKAKLPEASRECERAKRQGRDSDQLEETGSSKCLWPGCGPRPACVPAFQD